MERECTSERGFGRDEQVEELGGDGRADSPNSPFPMAMHQGPRQVHEGVC